MMVARDGVEPPTPAFSELIVPVFPTTSMLSWDCQTLESTSKARGPWVIAVGDPTRQEKFDLDLRDLVPWETVGDYFLSAETNPGTLELAFRKASDGRLHVADSNWPERLVN
jgi:hypothetical protein